MSSLSLFILFNLRKINEFRSERQIISRPIKYLSDEPQTPRYKRKFLENKGFHFWNGH